MGTEKKTSIIDIITIILSLAAIVISISSFYYTMDKDRKDNEEIVAIAFDSLGHDDNVRYNTAGLNRGQGFVGTKYKVIVANNSKQRVSFIKCDLFQSINSSKIAYGNLLENIYDSNNRVITFPISLEAGDSIGLILDLNETVPANVNMLILDKFNTRDLINFDELRDYLGENETDIYGNKVKYAKFGDGKRLIEIDKSCFPTYIFSLTSSKGNVYKGVITQNLD